MVSKKVKIINEEYERRRKEIFDNEARRGNWIAPVFSDDTKVQLYELRCWYNYQMDKIEECL